MARVSELCGRHQHQLCTQGPQRVHLLLRLVVRHDDDRLVTLGIGDQRHADAGIARRAFDHRAAGEQLAPRLGITDDPERRAVFHRGAGVGKFALAVDVAASRRTGAGEADGRGIADKRERVAKGAGNVHGD